MTADEKQLLIRVLEDSIKFTDAWGNNHPGPDGDCNRIAQRQCNRIQQAIAIIRAQETTQ